MSVQELKRQIAQLSVAEQTELESFLKAKRVADAAGYRVAVEAAHRRMDDGEAISSSELRALLQRGNQAAS